MFSRSMLQVHQLMCWEVVNWISIWLSLESLLVGIKWENFLFLTYRELIGEDFIFSCDLIYSYFYGCFGSKNQHQQKSSRSIQKLIIYYIGTKSSLCSRLASSGFDVAITLKKVWLMQRSSIKVISKVLNIRIWICIG